MAGECDTVLVDKSEGKRPLEKCRRRWGIILKRVFKKWDGREGTWSGLIWIRIGARVGVLVSA